MKSLIPARNLTVVEILKYEEEVSKFVNPEKKEKEKRQTVCKIVLKGSGSQVSFVEGSTVLVYTHLIESWENIHWVPDHAIIGMLEQ